MTEPAIAPLAKRLAEENNVEWRNLTGSGEDGRIVERDVLEYLAKVMAGEAAVDPTPEPLPEGMEAWPDEAPAATAGQGAPPSGGAEEDDGGLLVGDDGGEEDDGAGLLIDDVPSGGAEEVPAEETSTPGPAARPGAEDAHGEEDADLPDLFSDGGAPRDDQPDEDDLFDGELTFGDGEEAAQPAEEAELHAAGPDDDGFDFGGLPGHEQDAERGGAEAVSGLGGGPSFEEDASEAEVFGGAFGDEPEADRAEPPEVGPEFGAEAGTGAAPASAPAPAPTSAEAAAAPMARYRQILRRDVDLGPATAAGRSLGRELGRAEAVPALTLLAMAAARAAAALQRDGGVALAEPQAGGEVRLSGLGDGGLRAALQASEGEGGAAGDRPAVAVADLSRFGIDEAALDLEVPLLSLGRVLADNETGSLRASLTFAGDVPVDRGAAFLARVAELLEEPLRLLA